MAKLRRSLRMAVVVGLLLLPAAPAQAADSPAPPPAGGPLGVPVPPAAVWTSGVDVSWPECPPTMGIPERRGRGNPLPASGVAFAVLGLTNGPGWTPNPCLADELAWADRANMFVAAYAMTTYPTAAQLAAYGGSGPWPATTAANRLRNAGFAQALFNVATARSLGFRSPIVWIDIETYRGWDWKSDKAANRAVIQGVMAGYQRAGYRVGFYSSPYMWGRILGTGQGPRGYPEWRTAGESSPAAALAKCPASKAFAGGRAVLAQYWDPRKDHDLICPAFRTSTTLQRYFARW